MHINILYIAKRSECPFLWSAFVIWVLRFLDFNILATVESCAFRIHSDREYLMWLFFFCLCVIMRLSPSLLQHLNWGIHLQLCQMMLSLLKLSNTAGVWMLSFSISRSLFPYPILANSIYTNVYYILFTDLMQWA